MSNNAIDHFDQGGENVKLANALIQRVGFAAAVRHAVDYLQSGQHEVALQLCKQLLAQQPGHGMILCLLGIIQAACGNYTDANLAFERAIAAQPGHAQTHGNYANALLQQGRIDAAIDHSRQAISLDPQQAEPYNTLGSAYLQRSDPQAAVTSFEQALVLAPNHAQANNNLGTALLQLERTQEAIEYFKQAVFLAPAYADAWYNLGQALKHKRCIDDAADAFKQAVSIRPDYLDALYAYVEIQPAWKQPLHGLRCILRRRVADDAGFIHRCHGNAEFMQRYHRFAAPPRQGNTFGEDAHPCLTGAAEWLILTKDQAATPLGLISLVDIQYSHRRAEFQIGIVDPADRAARIGLEAALLLLDFTFNVARLNKLVALIYGDNLEAVNNAAALGFAREGVLREHILAPGQGLLEVIQMGLLRSDFRSNQRLSKLSLRLLERDITVAS